MIENAKLTGVEIDAERGLSLTLFFEGDGWAQGMGGYACHGDQEMGGFLAVAIERLLSVLGAEKFSDLQKGCIVRIERDGGGGCGSLISRVGHPLEHKWFDPKLIIEKMRLGEVVGEAGDNP